MVISTASAWDTDAIFGTARRNSSPISRQAAAHNAIVIDDVIPSHTLARGPDWRLAEMAHTRITPASIIWWKSARRTGIMLPPVARRPATASTYYRNSVDALARKGYIVGQLQRVIFFEPGVKDTDWSATLPITGVDGVTRRWVYLHYFKAGPALVQLAGPDFRGAADDHRRRAAFDRRTWAPSALRLDANGFLGVEARPGSDRAWSEGHPLVGRRQPASGGRDPQGRAGSASRS